MDPFTHKRYSAQRYQFEVPTIELPLRLVKRWPADIRFNARVTEGAMYAGGLDGVLRVFDTDNLECAATYRSDDWKESDWTGNLILSDSWLLAQYRSKPGSRLEILDRHSLELVDRFEREKSISLDKALAVENILVAVRSGPEGMLLFGFDVSTRTVLWEAEIRGTFSLFGALPCLLENRRHFVVDDIERGFSCRDIETGDVVWRYDFSDQDLSLGKSIRDISLRTVKALIGVGDRVYVALCNHLLALDASTGEEIWRTVTSIQQNASGMTYDESLDRLCFLFGAWYIAVDAETGEVVVNRKDRSQVPETGVLGWPTVTRDYFLAASWREPELYAFDKRDGSLVWKTELEDRVSKSSQPIVVGDRVYVADLSGNLYAFESASTG